MAKSYDFSGHLFLTIDKSCPVVKSHILLFESENTPITDSPATQPSDELSPSECFRALAVGQEPIRTCERFQGWDLRSLPGLGV